MPIYVDSPKTFVPAPEGQHNAVCCDVVDLGVIETEYNGQKSKNHKVRLVFQIGEERDGQGIADPMRYLKYLSLNALQVDVPKLCPKRGLVLRHGSRNLRIWSSVQPASTSVSYQCPAGMSADMSTGTSTSMSLTGAACGAGDVTDLSARHTPACTPPCTPSVYHRLYHRPTTSTTTGCMYPLVVYDPAQSAVDYRFESPVEGNHIGAHTSAPAPWTD